LEETVPYSRTAPLPLFLLEHLRTTTSEKSF